jgi:hypothetical protein
MRSIFVRLNSLINTPLQWEKETPLSVPISGFGYLSVTSILVALGISFVSIGNIIGRNDTPNALYFFWFGLAFMIIPVSVRFIAYDVSHPEAVGMLLLLSLGTFTVSYLRSPLVFRGFDEALHWRTAYDILQTKHLFANNPMLPVSPLYPGLESVTTALVNMSGLSIINAGFLIIIASRIIMLLSLYLLYEQITNSIRTAGIATLIYTGSSTFIFFDTQYSYETVALPLAILCIFLLARQAKKVQMAWLWKVFTALILFLLVPTHHVTTYVLIGLLILWVCADIIALFLGEANSSVWWAALALVIMVWFWVGVMAPNTIEYLSPILNGSISSFYNLLTGQSGARTLFENKAGESAMIFERLTGISSVLVLCATLPFGLWQWWLKYKRDSLAITFAAVAVSYPLLPLMRLSGGSWELSNRLSGSVFIGLGLIASLALAEFPISSRLLRFRQGAAILGITVIFIGGVIAGSPVDTRLAQSYRPAAEERSVDNQGVITAEWVRSVLRPGNHMAADRIDTQLMGSYGAQRVIGSLSDHVSISGIFLRYYLTPEEYDIINKTQIRYILIDRRITTALSTLGIYYESWEHSLVFFTPPPNISVLEKFNHIPGVSRIYDSGDIVIYDIKPLLNENP